mgnify:CR=1 FL=1
MPATGPSNGTAPGFSRTVIGSSRISKIRSADAEAGWVREWGEGSLVNSSNIEGVPRYERFWLGGDTLGPRVFETRTITVNGELIFAMAWLVLVLSIGAVSLLMLLVRWGEAARFALLSGGVIPLGNLALGLKVASALFLVFTVLTAFHISEALLNPANPPEQQEDES